MAELWSMLLATAVRAPDRTAILFEGQRISYGRLRDRAETLAWSLWRFGIRAGDRIAFLGANRPEYLELLLAAARIGAVLVPLNSRYGSSDMRGALKACGARMLFVAERFRKQDFSTIVVAACGGALPHGPASCEAVPDLETVVSLDRDAMGSVLYGDLLQTPEVLPAVGPDSGGRAGLAIFTSGSSGTPKPVLLNEAAMVKAARRLIDRQHISADDRILSFLPYFHVYGGLITTLAPLAAGATIVMQPAYDATQSLQAIEADRCTVIYGIAPCWQDWLDHPSWGRVDVSSIRTGICAAGSVASSGIARRVRDAVGPMQSHFGLSETAGVATMTAIGDDAELSTTTAGRPLPGVEIAIVDPSTGEAVKPDAEGEIRVRSDMAMSGYIGLEAATARAWAPGGWLRTGDRGILGHDGYLRVLGRLDDRLRCGGENVDPAEVEQFLNEHSAVARAFVVGVPHARLGQVPVAFVVGRHAPTPTSESDLIAWCRGRMADFKIPRRVYFIDEVPGGFQKVQRFKLREWAVQRIGADVPREAATNSASAKEARHGPA